MKNIIWKIIILNSAMALLSISTTQCQISSQASMISPASLNDHSRTSWRSISSLCSGKSFQTQNSRISQSPPSLWTLSSRDQVFRVLIPLLWDNSFQTFFRHVIANASCMLRKTWPMFGKWISIPGWLRKMGCFLTRKYGTQPQCHLSTLCILPHSNFSMLLSNSAIYFPPFDYGAISCNF